MSSTQTSRARDDEQKLARRKSLLDAGWGLFLELGQMPSVSQVVQAAGMAKGTFYLYFKTKEELFLELMSEALNELFGMLNESLVQSDITLESYVCLLANKFHKDHVLLKLGPMTAGVLEQNCEAEAVRKFRLGLIAQLKQAATHLHERFPMIAEAQAIRLLIRSYIIMQGAAQIIPSASVHAHLRQDPALKVLAMDFATEAGAMLMVLWEHAMMQPEKANQ